MPEIGLPSDNWSDDGLGTKGPEGLPPAPKTVHRVRWDDSSDLDAKKKQLLRAQTGIEPPLKTLRPPKPFIEQLFSPRNLPRPSPTPSPRADALARVRAKRPKPPTPADLVPENSLRRGATLDSAIGEIGDTSMQLRARRALIAGMANESLASPVVTLAVPPSPNSESPPPSSGSGSPPSSPASPSSRLRLEGRHTGSPIFEAVPLPGYPEASAMEATPPSDEPPELPESQQPGRPKLVRSMTAEALFAAATAVPAQDATVARKKTPQELRRRRPCPEGWFNRLSLLTGTVVSVRGLPRADKTGFSDPYVVVKGVRSNSCMIDIHRTQVMKRTLAADFEDEDFSIECPAVWGTVEMVGLRFLVYDSDNGEASFLGSDDFLGGADLDIADLKHGHELEQELELSGETIGSFGKGRKRKARLVVRITSYREPVPWPPSATVRVEQRLLTHIRPRRIVGFVMRADGLRNADALSLSDPFCVVRAILLDGEVIEIIRTRVIQDTLNPEWCEQFDHSFEINEEPVCLVFDVFDSDAADPDDVANEDLETAEHLGGIVLPVAAIPERAKRVAERTSDQISVHSDDDEATGGGGNDFMRLALGKPGLSLEHLLDARGKPRLKNVLHRKDQEGDLRKSMSRKSARNTARRTTQRQTGRQTVGRQTMRGQNACTEPSTSAKVVTALRTGCSEMCSRIFSYGKYAKHLGENKLVVEVETERVMMDMPNADVWCTPMQASQVEWERLEEIGKGHMSESMEFVKGVPYLVFVHGMVYGATGLISADFMGKSDPYCIIEGVSANGQTTFIHRTRVIQNNLCPAWHEAFHFAIPEDCAFDKLQFSVYDSDEGELTNTDHKDDFLGHAKCDLSHLRNGQRLCDELPLLGVKSVAPGSKAALHGKAHATGTFRRTATISIEAYVERRIYAELVEEQLEVLKPSVGVYYRSREPDMLARYEDPGQESLGPHDRRAETVMDLAQRGLLLESSLQRNGSCRGAKFTILQPRVDVLDGDDEVEVQAPARAPPRRPPQSNPPELCPEIFDMGTLRRPWEGGPPSPTLSPVPSRHGRFLEPTKPHLPRFVDDHVLEGFGPAAAA